MFAKLIELPEGQVLLTKEEPVDEEHEGMVAGLVLRMPDTPDGDAVRARFAYATKEARDEVFDRFDPESAADAYRDMFLPMLRSMGFVPREN